MAVSGLPCETSALDPTGSTPVGRGLEGSKFLSEEGKQEVRHLILEGASDEDVADTLWKHLGLDFAQEFKGAEARIIGPDGESGPRGNIVEAIIPKDSYERFRKRSKTDVIKIQRTFFAINLNMSRAGLNLVACNRARVSLRFPSPTVFLSLLHFYHPDRFLRLCYLSQPFDHDLGNRLHAIGSHPMTLPLSKHYVGDTGAWEHPFFFAWHDLFHALKFFILPPSLQSRAAVMHEALQEAWGRYPQTRVFLQEFLDVMGRLTDLDFIRREHMEHDLAHLFIQPFRDTVVGLMDRAHFNPSAKRKLKTFAQFFRMFLQRLWSGSESTEPDKTCLTLQRCLEEVEMAIQRAEEGRRAISLDSFERSLAPHERPLLVTADF